MIQAEPSTASADRSAASAASPGDFVRLCKLARVFFFILRRRTIPKRGIPALTSTGVWQSLDERPDIQTRAARCILPCRARAGGGAKRWGGVAAWSACLCARSVVASSAAHDHTISRYTGGGVGKDDGGMPRIEEPPPATSLLFFLLARIGARRVREARGRSARASFAGRPPVGLSHLPLLTGTAPSRCHRRRS